MEFITHKIYQYKDIADMVAQDALDDGCRIIGLTGTSSIGKSTFSKIIQERLAFYGVTSQILSADNYLKHAYQAGTSFWNRLDSSYLKPEHFDWEPLSKDAAMLFNGQSFSKECYVRGTGWGVTQTFAPTDVLIIEGLFLDSVQAAQFMTYDILISLTAPDSLITALRIERDAYYRRTSPTFKRTEAETLLEIENTLRASKSYTPFSKWPRHLHLGVKGNYNATLHLA